MNAADRAEFGATIPEPLAWRVDVDPVTGCFHAVRGPRSGNHHAYPALSIDGKSVLLHRHLWTHVRGPIREDRPLIVRTCWAFDCIRISHMQPMTWSELSTSWRTHHGNRSSQPVQEEISRS